MTNLATTLARTTARYPDRAAVCMDERVMRYRDLDETSARAASWLSGRGIGAGDRVGLMLPNVPEFPGLYYGILRAGAIVVPMNPLLKSREIEYYLADSGAALVLAWHGVADQAAEGARRAGTDLVIIEPGELAGILAGHAPVAMAHPIPTTWPKEWNRGSAPRTTSSGRRFSSVALVTSILRSRLSWVSSAPFGWPVVPEV